MGQGGVISPQPFRFEPTVGEQATRSLNGHPGWPIANHVTAYAIVRAPADRVQAAVGKLASLGVAAEADAVGTVTGRMRIPLDGLPRLDGIGLSAMLRIRSTDMHSFAIDPPSPAARIGAVEFDAIEDEAALIALVTRRWRRLVAQTDKALARARRLAPSAKVRLDPFRLEGAVERNGESIHLVFATKGHRACVSGIGRRTVDFMPNGARVVLDTTADFIDDELWRRAIDQARECLGPEPVVITRERHRSIDLLSCDIDLSAAASPTPDLGSLDLTSADLGSDDL